MGTATTASPLSHTTHAARPWWALCVPIALALLFALATSAVSGKGAIDLGDYKLYQLIVVCLAFFVAGFELVWRWLVVLPASRCVRQPRDAAQTPSEHRLPGFGTGFTATLAGVGIILACWFIYLVCLYPGTMWYDTSWQVYEYYRGSLSDHHPFALAYVYGAFIDLGRALFNDGAVGMFVLIVLQCIAAATALSLICQKLAQLGARRGACLACLAFFALFPFMPMMFASIVKDTLHAVLFAYFSLLFVSLCADEALRRKPWAIVAATLLAIAICFCKKTGVFMVAIPLLALGALEAARGGWSRFSIWPIALGAVTLLLTFIIVPKLVMPALGVEPGGKQEALAVPIQQVAHEYVLFDSQDERYADAFSEADVRLLDDFLPIDHESIPEKFDYTIADPIKNGSLDDPSLAGDFMALWARLGTAHPLGHFESWIGMEAGWFSLTKNLTVKVASGTIANRDFVAQYVTWPDADVTNDFVTALYNLGDDIPVLGTLYRISLWASVLPAFCLFVALCCRSRHNRIGLLILCSPLLMCSLTLMACPVSTGVEAARYVIPLACIAPLYVGAVVLAARAERLELARASSEASPEEAQMPWKADAAGEDTPLAPSPCPQPQP